MTDHTALRHRVAAAAAVGAATTLLSSCGHIPSEEFPGLVVKNATAMTLTVGEQGEVGPGATPPGAGGSTPLTLKPGQVDVLRISLYRGVCARTAITAYDQAGHLIATLPSPICEDKKGHGNTWTIKQP